MSVKPTLLLPWFVHVEDLKDQQYPPLPNEAAARQRAEEQAARNPGKAVHVLRCEVSATCEAATIRWREAAPRAR